MKVKELILMLMTNCDSDAEVWSEYPDMGFGDWHPTQNIEVIPTSDKKKVTFVING